MRLHLLERHPLLGVSYQDALDEMLSFIAKRVKVDVGIRTVLQVKVGNVRVRRILVSTGEGGLTCEQLEGEDTYCPRVNLVVVGLLIDEFWGDVVDRTAESSSALIDGVS